MPPQPRPKRVLRTGLVGEIAEALESGQIKPWFQPQISTDTGEVSGMEALARWEHPERGVILPGAFLPAISAAGLNERLSEVILYQLADRAEGLGQGGAAACRASRSISRATNWRDPKLCDKIRWELDRFDLDPTD